MTVADLIRFLEKLPRNTKVGVLYRCFSDVAILEEEDMDFIDKAAFDELDEKERQGIHLWGSERRRYVLRHGKLMEYDRLTWDPNEKPEFVPVLILPGN